MSHRPTDHTRVGARDSIYIGTDGGATTTKIGGGWADRSTRLALG